MPMTSTVLILIAEIALALVVIGVLVWWFTDRRRTAHRTDERRTAADDGAPFAAVPSDPNADLKPARIPFAGADFQPLWASDPRTNDPRANETSPNVDQTIDATVTGAAPTPTGVRTTRSPSISARSGGNATHSHAPDDAPL